MVKQKISRRVFGGAVLFGVAAAVGRASGAAVESVISPVDPKSLHAGIEAAYRSGQKKVIIPPGIYRIGAAGGMHLKLADLHGLEIDATGVTLLRTEPTAGGIEFHRCSHVTLRGMTLVNETLPFTQGTIEKIEPEGKWYDLRVARGYPAKWDDPKRFESSLSGYVFDASTRQWKAGTTDVSGQSHVIAREVFGAC